MTSANIFLTYQQRPYLFSINSDAYPNALAYVIDEARRPFQPSSFTELAEGNHHSMLRVDAYYTYTINLDTKQVQVYKNRCVNWDLFRQTAVGLSHQITHVVAPAELLPLLPDDWQLSPTELVIAPFAEAYDAYWHRITTLIKQRHRVAYSQLINQLTTMVWPVGLALDYSKTRKLPACPIWLYAEGICCQPPGQPDVLRPYTQWRVTELRRLLGALD